MPLQKQMYSIPFTGGLDEKASDKHLQPPKLDLCNNGKFSKNGQVQKRNGFTRLANTSFISGSASTVDASVQCASYQNEKLIFDGNNAYTRSASGTWVDKGRITGCTFKDSTAFNNDAMTSGQLAAASANGYRVESWAEADPDTAIVPHLATNTTYHIYTRVVDEGTGVVVVPKTRITPAAGIVVTKAHAQNNDSNYLNPQVQAVTMGDYVFVLLCDCQQHDPKVNVTAITDRGSGTIGVQCDADHNLLYQDVVTLAGGTGYDGNYIVTGIPSSTLYEVTAVFGSTGTGTSTVKQTYSSGMVNGVHAVAIDTGSDIAAGLTPTALANFNSPAFYVNGVYPLFSVAAADNSTTDDTATPKAAVFRFNTAPINDAAATVPSYRLDYFEEASGVFQEWEDTAPGFRGRNTPILPADRVAYFQASKAGHSDTDRTLSHIALNAIDADDRLMIAATFEESGTPTNPEVRVKMYTDALGTTGAAVTDLAQSSQCLTSGSFLKQLTGTDLQFVWTGQVITEGSAVSPDSGQAADHALWKGEITTTGTVKSQIIVKHFTTLTSDLFSYNGKIYFGATYAITPNASFYIDGGDFTFVNFGSSINLISDTGGNIIATGGTGLGGNCASTDWLPNAVDDRTMFWGVGRVTAISASKFSFGSAKFSGVSEGGNVVYQAKSIFNPSYSEIDFLPTRNLPAAEGSGSLLLCGGLLWEYGGDAMKENGFLTYPQTTDVITNYVITAVGDAGGGSSVFQIDTTTPHGLEVGDTVQISDSTHYDQPAAVITVVDKATNTFTIVDAFVATDTGVVALTGGVLGNGAYNYKIIYEWVGANGDIQRSYPSDGVTAEIAGVTGTNGRVRLKVYTPQWTQKSLANGVSNPTIVLYRTGLGESIFYRAAAAPVDFSEAGSSSTQTLDDGLVSNSAIGDNEHIYSTGDAGDVFGNMAPPCSTDIVVHKNRVFLAINDGSVWYSKKLVPKRGVEFSDLQVKPIENYSASIACLGAVRDYVIVVTAEDAYFLAGDGPNAAGIGTDFSPPTIFSRDSGATDGCARANSPVGFIYHAKGGIYRVTPSMQMEWIGAPVEDTVDDFGISRVVVNDSEGEIYFGLNATTKGILVYNYVFNAWSKWLPKYASFSNDITPKGMMVHNGTLNFAIPSGHLLEQNTGFTDIGSETNTYTLHITTPWLRSEQFLHMVRFYNILISGTFKSNHTLNCTIYSNYDESVADNQTLAITTSTDDPYIFRQHVANQKARAIKLSIVDTPSSGTFESYQLDGIAVEFGVRPGTFKLGTTKTLT